MAHELSFDSNGFANFFEVGKRRTAWHGEGHHLLEAPTLDKALEIGGIDYSVELRPTFIAVGNDDYIPSKKAFITYRPDRAIELGSVGPDYTVLQNRDAFRVLEPLLDAGICRLETGGVLRDGADAWLLAQFNLDKFGPVCREVFGDEVIPFALVTNNHAGRRNATVATTPIRVVCANTLGMAESAMDSGISKSIGVRHTGDAQQRLVEAAETLFQALIERYEAVAKSYKLLKEFIMTDAQFKTLVLDVAVPDPRDNAKFNPEARMANAVVERYEAKANEITRLWTAGKGHKADKSAWEAYNGVVEAVDHNTELFPMRSGVYRTQALLDGTLRTIKADTLNSLVAATA